MINRCRYCNDICPDFSDICDTCAYIQEQENSTNELRHQQLIRTYEEIIRKYDDNGAEEI